MKLVSDRFVPHVGPEDADIIFIGDAPNTADDVSLTPFSGSVEDFLDKALETIGYTRDTVRLANVLNYQPLKNDFRKAHTSWQLDESRSLLKNYLATHKHKVIVPMGDAALDFIMSFDGITKRRGSVYKYKNAYVIPMMHPSVCLRDGSAMPTLLHDLAKLQTILESGWEECSFKNFIVDPDIFTLEGLLPTILAAPRTVVDIETKMHTSYIRCIGFAWSSLHAVCIFNDAPYSEEHPNAIGSNFRRIVEKLLQSDVPKTFHNGMFDTIMLEENGFSVENWTYDTMVAQHVLQPELPLGLDYCTSMYTDINYYKDDGKETSDRIDRTRLGIYNCKDVVATWQTQDGQALEFSEAQSKYTYFLYKMKQIPLAKHFSTTGMLVDPDRRDELNAVITSKRDADYSIFIGIQQMMGVELFKVSQSARIKDFLYKTLGLNVKTNREGKVTADEDAIVELLATVEKKVQDLKTDAAKQPWQIKLAALKLILRIRGYDKLLGSYIDIELSNDGRARSWYKFWGTETGRWSASQWYDGTGLNGQTIPRESL